MAKKNVEVQAVVEVASPVNAVVNPPIVPTTIGELWTMIDARLKAIEDRITFKTQEGNGRGPLSTRPMTVEDAKRIMFGDMKDSTIKTCAKDLGLSYGQIYSARNGYTFKEQYAEMVKRSKAAKK